MEPHLYAEMAQVERDHWWFVARRRIVGRVLDRVLAKGQDLNLLEVGCGTGGNGPLLRDYGQLTGVEPNPAAHPFLTAAGYTFIASGLPGPLPLTDGAFDAVLALDVLEHLTDEGACLAEMVRLLRPGGVLVLTVPAYAFLWSGHDVVNHHHRRYTRAQLRQVVAAAGVQPVMVSYFNTLLFPLIAGVRLAAKALKRQEKSDLVLPPSPLNRLLQQVFAAERHLLGRFFPLPFGVSLLGVWRKPL